MLAFLTSWGVYPSDGTYGTCSAARFRELFLLPPASSGLPAILQPVQGNRMPSLMPLCQPYASFKMPKCGLFACILHNHLSAVDQIRPPFARV